MEYENNSYESIIKGQIPIKSLANDLNIRCTKEDDQ